MSDLIIKIGDDALDLNVNETIAITKQAAKVGDFSTVLADGTNEVKIPLTPNNMAILDNANVIQTDSDKPYGRLEATLIQEGYETIQDGYAIIKSSANDFSLQVVGGNASFFNLIKDANIRDLDWSDYDHFWTNAEVFARRNETEGLIYAVFEQSEADTTMTTYSSTPNDRYAVETDLLLPSFYIKSIIDKIFDAQGYTFATDLSSEDIYDKAIDFRAETPNRGNDMSYHECTVESDFLDVANTTLFDSAIVTGTATPYNQSSDFQDALESPDKRFTLTDACRVTVDISINVFYTQNTPYTNTLQVNVIRTGGATIATEQISIPIGVVGDPNDVYDFSITFDVNESPDGEVYFQLMPVCASAFGFYFDSGSSYTVRDVELLSNTPVTTTFPNNYITGALPISDMKQGDFLKELARMYQWIFDVDERTKTVAAKRFDQIKENIVNAKDLSDKLDANDINVKFGIDVFAQTNALRYKEDDTTLYDAVGYINVSDTTLKPEKDYVNMEQFAASSTRKRFGTVNAPYVPIFDEDLLPTIGLTDRIILVRRETFSENVNFNRDTESPANLPTTDLTFAYFAESGNTDSLDFPTLITRFYQTVIDMNDRGKTVECKMNLNIKDVEDYDPFVPVYIQHFGNYFYWEKVSNYVKGKLTKCIFVKI